MAVYLSELSEHIDAEVRTAIKPAKPRFGRQRDESLSKRGPVSKDGPDQLDGRVSEWFKEPVLKTGVRETVPWVRIPPLPPFAA